MIPGPIRRLLLAIINHPRARKPLRFMEACRYLDRHVWDYDWGNRVIREALLSGQPHAIGKLGTAEQRAIRAYLATRRDRDPDAGTAGRRKNLYTYAGVFPDDYATYARFCQFMMDDVLPAVSIVGVWFSLDEATLIKRYCRNAPKVPAEALHKWDQSPEPWTAALAGRRVLVAHPFEQTIRQQYARRERIWPNHPLILPAFHLDTLKVPHYPHLERPKHPDWFASLQAMCDEMDRREFDVVLIGAGAYSLPLAVHARKLGKVGIHLGGATQVVFGIKGRRWDNAAESCFYNEAWSRPLPADTPPGNQAVEDGCYW